MGKTTRWFKALLGAKKSPSDSPASSVSDSRQSKHKKKWGPFKSSNSNVSGPCGTGGSSIEVLSLSPYVDALDANKHAIAVAAATAAVAEAALAAAQAAAEVVRLTSGGTGSRTASAYVSGGFDRWRELAAVKIQSAFRAYLARRALRALKGLVKLQALVRGRIVRKQSADMLRRMQAMARIQAQACANRTHLSESSHASRRSSQSHHHDLAASQKYDHQFRSYGTKLDGSSMLKRYGSKSSIKDSVGLLSSNWLDCWMEENSWNIHRDTSPKTGRIEDEKSDKILEIDTWKPRLNLKQSERASHTSQSIPAWHHSQQEFLKFDTLARQSSKSRKPNPARPSGEMSSLRSLKFPLEIDQAAVGNAENSPQVHSALSRPGSSSRRGPFTPRSECSRSLFGDYLSHPNYMAYTESSRAKVRSHSAPRQRMQFEKTGSTKRFVHGFSDADTNSDRGSTLHANFRNKDSPGSGHFNRLGTPTQGATTAYSSTYGSKS
ncbi:unnamed protein product [Ilex paraguariensis]|uniref:DUF4005 domain-containing protein n=1 Tax=Ilex paraguariensis TaxID=185542 RepID=A0ABC8QZP7_9AQUA